MARSWLWIAVIVRSAPELTIMLDRKAFATISPAPTFYRSVRHQLAQNNHICGQTILSAFSNLRLKEFGRHTSAQDERKNMVCNFRLGAAQAKGSSPARRFAMSVCEPARAMSSVACRPERYSSRRWSKCATSISRRVFLRFLTSVWLLTRCKPYRSAFSSV